VFTLLGSLFSVRVQVRPSRDRRIRVGVKPVATSTIDTALQRRTPNREHRTANSEPNLNTNREERTQKREQF